MGSQENIYWDEEETSRSTRDGDEDGYSEHWYLEESGKAPSKFYWDDHESYCDPPHEEVYDPFHEDVYDPPHAWGQFQIL